MNKLEIFLLNARDNVILDLLENYVDDYKIINHEINNLFYSFKEILDDKKIEYKSLKSALIPNKKKNEVVLLFDRLNIKSNFYSNEIFDVLLSLLEVDSVNSFLCGDYVDIVNNQDFLKDMLFKELSSVEYPGYKHSNQIYIIYINNVSDGMIKKLREGLIQFEAFVGLIDVSFNSLFKSYISLILSNSFLKVKKNIIMEHPDDVDNINNKNTLGYSFEKLDYNINSLQSLYYNLFLSYKIESDLSGHNEGDLKFSICSLTPDILSLDSMFIKITDEKIKYLETEKNDSMKILGALSISRNELETKIKDKIRNGYFFNLRICDEDNSCLLNMILEVKNGKKRDKIMLSLKYLFDERQLFLITLF